MPHVHNGLHEYNRLLDGAARAIGEKSGAQDFSGIERFGETLTPTMDLWALPEWALLRGEVLFARRCSSGAVAARFSSIEFVNPAGTGVIAVLSTISSGGTDIQAQVDSGIAIAANPVVRRGVALDTRFPQLGEVSRCSITEGDVAAGLNLPQYGIPPNGERVVNFIVVPGFKVFITGFAVNTAISASLFFTERPLLPTESRA